MEAATAAAPILSECAILDDGPVTEVAVEDPSYKLLVERATNGHLPAPPMHPRSRLRLFYQRTFKFPFQQIPSSWEVRYPWIMSTESPDG